MHPDLRGWVRHQMSEFPVPLNREEIGSKNAYALQLSHFLVCDDDVPVLEPNNRGLKSAGFPKKWAESHSFIKTNKMSE